MVFFRKRMIELDYYINVLKAKLDTKARIIRIRLVS